MPILDKKDKNKLEEYEEYIKSYDGSSLTQSVNWVKVKSNWDWEGVYIENEGKIVAATTILIQKIPFFSSTFMYAPRGPVCDITNLKVAAKLTEEVDILAKQKKAYIFKMDPAIKYDEELVKSYKSLGFNVNGKNFDKDKLFQPIHEAVLNIEDKTEDELLKEFSEKTRYNIRLANRKGVEVYYSNKKEDLKIFYDIYKVTTVRDNIGCRAYEYFERILDSYDKDQIRVYIAKHENDYLSGALAFNYGKELFYLYGASSNEKRNLMPNYAMQWEMIKWGLETSCNKYNFGGVVDLDPNNGLYKFKIGFCKKDGLTEYIGEIDKIYNKKIYILSTKFIPLVKKSKRLLKNIKNKMIKK